MKKPHEDMPQNSMVWKRISGEIPGTVLFLLSIIANCLAIDFYSDPTPQTGVFLWHTVFSGFILQSERGFSFPGFTGSKYTFFGSESEDTAPLQ